MAATGPIVVIPCGARKLPHRAPAGELYTGSYHRACRRAADRVLADLGGELVILSAKHGLLAPDTEIDPYELRLAAGCVRSLGRRVARQAEERGWLDRQAVVLAGSLYAGVAWWAWPDAVRPLGRLFMGQQLQILARIAREGLDTPRAHTT